jgi:hypothetical protein
MRLVTLAVVAMVVSHTTDAVACDRSPSLFEALEVGVAVADVVVSGEVTAIADGVATVKVTSTLKGAPGNELQLRGAMIEMNRCGGLRVEIGKRYVFLLWAAAGQLTAYHVIDQYGGVLDAASEQKARDALAKGHPHSAWLVKGDVATMLVLEPPDAKDEVDVSVVLRNIGAKPKTYRFASWPRQTMTKCTLSITNTETNKRVAAKAVPIAQKDISTYFTRNSRKWETKIAVGAAQHVRLDRITTAKPGWGYKEELGFVYYPIETAGAHSVSAECANVFGVGTRALTSAVTLTL